MTGLPPAKRLLGLVLDGDWEVIEERPSLPRQPVDFSQLATSLNEKTELKDF